MSSLLVKCLFLFFLFIFNICNAQAYERTLVSIYAYHLKPPFIVSEENHQGLYYDFSEYLNEKSQQYTFTTVFVPRKRVELMVNNGQLDGMLLGVNPIWFGDKQEKRFLWSANIYHDQDEMISLSKTPTEYTGPASLKGKVLGGVRGFSYFGVDDLVKSGEVERHDTIGEREILMMLLAGRVDVGIVSRSTYQYLLRKENWQNIFHLSQQPHDNYQRRLMAPLQLKNIFEHIAPMIEKLPDDPKWQAILDKY